MYISIFTDELSLDVKEVLPIIQSWGIEYVDFRSRINGRGIDNQSDEELYELKALVDRLGLKVGALQTSLCKVHLPDVERQVKEQEKLEGIIRASNILGTKLVRCFNYWQQEPGDTYFGKLAMMADQMSEVLTRFEPIAKRAKEAGLELSFENCGQTPEEIFELLKNLNVPEWGMAWDVANYFDVLPEAADDCIEYFTKALKYSNMIHVKSWGVIPELGYKPVPWERVLAGAATLGKDFPVSIETHNPSDSPYSKDEASLKVYEHIKRAWPSSAPGDLKSALAVKTVFERSYSDNPVRFVVVGLGMGKNRAIELVETNGCKLYGVCDLDEPLAKSVGELLDVPYSTDMETFLKDPLVEVMYVVTETGKHCEIAERCLDAGKHVLMTKPMDASSEKCLSAIEKAKKKGLLLGLDFDFQFDPMMMELKDAIDDGFFGKLLSANVALKVLRSDEYYKHNNGWRGTWALDGGGALSNQGIHEVMRMISLFGMPSEVKGRIETKNHDIEAEDFGVSEWKYDNGLTVAYSSTTCFPASSWSVRLEIFGSEGAFMYTVGGPEGDHAYWWKNGTWDEVSPYFQKRQWSQASDNFASCLRLGGNLVVGWSDGYRSRYLLDKIYESAKNNQEWVRLGNYTI
jgi:predicted dehydrogenase/sugar phosphate isomerase/epimerase